MNKAFGQGYIPPHSKAFERLETAAGVQVVDGQGSKIVCCQLVRDKVCEMIDFTHGKLV